MNEQIEMLARMSWFFLLMGVLGFAAYVLSWFAPLPVQSDGNFTLCLVGIGVYGLLRIIRLLNKRVCALEAAIGTPKEG